MTGLGLRFKQRTKLRLLAVVAGLTACVLPRLVLGQELPFQQATDVSPFHAASGSVSGESGNQLNTPGRGFGAQITAGHIAGEGVGRQESISHVGVMPYITTGPALMFGDARIVRANRGNTAWSIGGGTRLYNSATDTVLGLNAYYDFDELSGEEFEQFGAGGELLGRWWEWRGNYYRPQGRAIKELGSSVVDGTIRFVGNTIIFDRIRTLAQAFEGFDTEVGMLLPGELADKHQIRAFGGYYWYDGQEADDISGWKLRLQGRMTPCIDLSLQLTDDDTFATNLTFGASFTFGGFKRAMGSLPSAYDRMGEPVRRNYHMVIANSSVTDTPLTAVNPDTGADFNIVHVNSANAGGTGTVDDPFETVALAQAAATPADIIYVHAGSSYAANPDNNITVRAGERIFGEGLIDSTTGRVVTNTITIDEIGALTLPDSPTFAASGRTLARPTLLNSSGPAAINMLSDSELSGFIVSTPAATGLRAGTVTGVTVRDTLIQNAVGDGILIEDGSGTFDFIDVVVDSATGAGLHVSGGAPTVAFTSSESTVSPLFGRIINSAGNPILIENTTGGIVNTSLSQTDDTGGDGIRIVNAAGAVTIDNATITNSTDRGISIEGTTTGPVTFRNSVNAATVIDNATGTSISLTGFPAGNTVTFGDVNITNRNGVGLNIDSLAGSVVFTGNVAIDGAAVGTGNAVNFTQAAPTGSVLFEQNLVIDGASGSGIFISLNEVDPPAPLPTDTVVAPVVSRSSFTVNGLTGISDTLDAAVRIVDNDSTVEFNGIGIANRSQQGIEIVDTRGAVTLNGLTSIGNEFAALFPAIDIQTSPGAFTAEGVSITNGEGVVGTAAGINLANNIANAQGDAAKRFESVAIQTNSGQGIRGRENSSVSVAGGTITSVGDSAIDVDNSVIDADPDIPNLAAFSLTSVNVDGADNGISIVNPGREGSRLNITGDPLSTLIDGSGGTIQNSNIAGVSLVNAGDVDLDHMTLSNNEVGILVRNNALATDDDQSVTLEFTQVSDSDVRGIDSLNLSNLVIEDSLFTLNGDDAALGRETILASYDELLNSDETDEFEEFDNPYLVGIARTLFTDESDDVLVIQTLPGAEDSHLNVSIASNTFTVADLTDPDVDDLDDDAIFIDWNGPALVEINDNIVNLTNEGHTGINLQFDSVTDEAQVDVLANEINGIFGGLTFSNNIGIRVNSRGPMIGNVNNNLIAMTGGNNTGFAFRIAENSTFNVLNNEFTENTDAGNGMIFETVAGPTNIGIEGNIISLADIPGGTEQGIVFNSVSGVANLFGTQNNIVQILNPTGFEFVETVFFMPGGTANGTIRVNGTDVP